MRGALLSIRDKGNVMKLDLGCKVWTSDGRALGKVNRIILESGKMTVREFVVHQRALFGHDRIVPISQVDHVDSDGIVYLKIDAEQAMRLPEFVKAQQYPVFTRSMPPPPSVTFVTQQGSVPADAVVLSHRTNVRDTDDKYVGYLDKVEFDASGRATHIVLESGNLILWDVAIPVSLISAIRHDKIELNATAVDLMEPVV
jgi:sporulation protein YlmC with PRC-barrel domain